jgi:hypothetical protein
MTHEYMKMEKPVMNEKIRDFQMGCRSDERFPSRCEALILLLLCCAITLLSACSFIASQNERAPNAAPKSIRMTLSRNDISEYGIVLPVSPTPQEKEASEILKKYLSKISGAKFEVLKEGKESEKPFISVGKTELLRKSELSLPADLGNDGYFIGEKDGDIFLTGGTRRGPLNAVIALLTEDAGCRWYSSDSAPVIPRKNAISLTPRWYVPKLKTRELLYKEAFNSEWAFFNRLTPSFSRFSTIPKKYGGTIHYPKNCFVHTYKVLVPERKYAKPHPEYYALINGKRRTIKKYRKCVQLCLSNPDLLNTVVENAIAIIKRNPDCEIISVSQNDSRNGFCQCGKCREMNKRLGGLSGSNIHFANKVAEKINETYPDVKVSTLAYQETFETPKSGVKPMKNVIVQLCTDTHIWDNPFFFATETGGFSDALKSWNALGADIYIWDYTVDFTDYISPFPNMTVIDHNLNFYMRNNVKGVMFQGDHQSFGAARAAMRCWVLARKLWDPSLNMDELIQDFTYGYFGEAADEMMEYNKLLASEWKVFHEKNKPGTGFVFSNAFLSCAGKLLARALKKCAHSPEIRSRVEKEELAVLFLRLNEGPLNLKDISSYELDIAKFRRYIKKFNVTRYHERRPEFKDKLEEWGNIVIWKKRWFETTKEKIRSNGIILGIVNAKFPHIPRFAAKVVMDDSSLFKLAARQPGNNKQWSVQYPLKRVDFDSTKNYALRIRCRVEMDKYAEGAAFEFGVYDLKTKKEKSLKLDSSLFHNGKYTWLNLFTIRPNRNTLLFTAPVLNENIKAIFIDAIEMTPAEKGYKRK